jgi:hypothetical protein
MNCPENESSKLMEVYNSPDYKARSDYRGIVGRWKQLVPESQLLVCFFDEIASAPTVLLNRIATFLGIAAPSSGWANANAQIHSGRTAVVPNDVMDSMVARNLDALRYLSDEFDGYATKWRHKYI